MEFAAPFLRGAGLGLGLIVAIGAQNAFVLERGLARDHVLAVVLVCAFADALLILAGVAGLGSAIAAMPEVIVAVRYGGAAFLAAYAILALKRALAPASLQTRGARQMGLKAALGIALSLTFLNPHVYLDTVVLLGSLSSVYGTVGERAAYGAGAMTASFAWFFALGFGARYLAPLFARPLAWRVLDGAIAFVMASLALALAFGG